ncbi:hypothetical protein PsorP6_013099 [Peronosclerospora sorghi]|uniref:Uncharacterized protein n=1 Tax=Peronosclerospora sorghi TaxID=230839 RepID=A0ACC0WG08_9STRA|nr:hypothetical protein PsorP6_013099 [Peronosclerospora sorghi]
MNDSDKVFVDGMEALEKYLNEHEVLCAKLKKAFLMLTKAKLRLPEHALSEVSYHEEFEASRVVTLDMEGNWTLQNAIEAKAQEAGNTGDGASLHSRYAGRHTLDKDSETLVDRRAPIDSDTLLWFSSLPPSDLRQAKKQFSSGT